MRRSVVILAALSMVLAPGLPATVSGAVTSFCSDIAPPCIQSATRDGSPVTSTDPTWSVTLTDWSHSGSMSYSWAVQKGGDYELGPDALDDVWVITVNMGSIEPRVSFIHGTDASTSRSGSMVTVTATPVILTEECYQDPWPWTCDEPASGEWVGYLDGEITDYGSWDDAAQRAAFYGMNYATNVAATSMPPEIEADPVTGEERILIRLANSHFRTDGTTVFEGEAHLRIPNAFLKEVYGIDAPATMTGSGLVPAVSGPAAGSGTASVTQEPSGEAMLVDIDGVTFSSRLVRIKRGTITPTKPRNVRALRPAPARGKLKFAEAKPRGSRIVKHQAKCVSATSRATGWAKDSPIVLTGLQAGTSYTCRVRAKSKAGFGAWSKKVRLRA